MKRIRVFLYLICFMVSFFAFCEVVVGQSYPPNPPSWSLGDWWIVECQVFDLGKVVSRTREPAWSPKQAWRFQVENIDSIKDQPYFVVSVRPMEGNSCPYWFRYWFRVSDRYVGRQELFHPTGTVSKTREIGPPVVTKDFPLTGAAPFFSGKFPMLPITVPIFNLDRSFVSFGASGGKFETSQGIEEAEESAVVQKADSNLLSRVRTKLMSGNKLITISTPTDINERQYWNPEIPWCVYGERFDKSYLSRRYWLVEMGHE